MWRGFLQRRAFAADVSRVVRVQAAVRGWVVRCQMQRLAAAVVAIVVRYIRGFTGSPPPRPTWILILVLLTVSVSSVREGCNASEGTPPTPPIHNTHKGRRYTLQTEQVQVVRDPPYSRPSSSCVEPPVFRSRKAVGLTAVVP